MTRMQEVQAALGVEGRGTLEIHGVSTATSPRPETLSFFTAWSEDAARVVAANPRTVFLVPADADTTEPNVIPTARPRLAYAQVLRDVLNPAEVASISPTAYVDPDAEVGPGV